MTNRKYIGDIFNSSSSGSSSVLGGFTPTFPILLTNCFGWYNADAVNTPCFLYDTTNISNVSFPIKIWNDISGNNHNLVGQATGSTSSVSGQSFLIMAISVNGTILNSPAIGVDNSDFSICFVMLLNNFQAGFIGLETGSTSNFRVGIYNNDVELLSDLAGEHYAGYSLPQSYKVVSLVKTNSSLIVKINGSTIYTYSGNFTSTSAAQTWYASSNNSQVQIKELVLYTRAWTSAEESTLVSSLQSKYSI